MRYTISCFAVLAALALPFAGQAYLDAPEAGNGTLDDAGDFMTYCSDAAHALACNGRVRERNGNDIAFLSDKCASAKPYANDSETDQANARRVVDWIVSHPELASGSTDGAIKKAVLTLSPCRRQQL